MFRYKAADEQDNYTGTKQDHIWFANQVPDFACATIALLNIVNNIPGLQMGKELRDFKDLTAGMDSVTRGETIDSFAFVRRIHNSFARENDLLQADMHLKAKIAKSKRLEAAAKARATRAAKRAAISVPLLPKGAGMNPRPARASTRMGKIAETPLSEASTPASKEAYSAAPSPELDGEFEVSSKPSARRGIKGKKNTNGTAEPSAAPRRSARPPKPRVTTGCKESAAEEEEEEEPSEGFHFIAYIPIEGRVWKLDGLDYYPHDMGHFGIGGNGADGGSGNWMHVVAPAIQGRMLQFEGAEIEFSLLAVVRDPIVNDRKDLIGNVKLLQVIDHQLDTLHDVWRTLEGAETGKDVVTGPSIEFSIAQSEIDRAEIPPEEAKEVGEQENFMPLIEYRQKIIEQQAIIRAAIRDGNSSEKDDDEKARHRRHDYGSFVRKWMGALAEDGILGDVIDN